MPVLVVAPIGVGFEESLAPRLDPDESVRWVPHAGLARELTQSQRFSRVYIHPYIPGLGGVRLAQRLRRRLPELPITLIGDRAGADLLRVCRQNGFAFEDLTPPDPGPASTTGPAATGPRAPGRARSRIPARGRPWWLEGSSPPARTFEAELDGCRELKDPVVLLVDPGARPEEIARFLHDRGPRRSGPFVTLDVRSLSDLEMTRRLCGVVQGAFKGADETVEGAVEAAHQGTLFLEGLPPGELAFPLRLSRMIPRGEVTRLGGRGVIEVDVRWVTSCAVEDFPRVLQPLRELLSVLPIRVPPLRQRIPDLPAMVRRRLRERLVARGARAPRPSWSAGARRAVMDHPFPGNESEIEALVSRLVAAGEAGLLRHEVTESLIRRSLDAVEDPLAHPMVPLERVDDAYIRMTLKAVGGRKGRAAERLGLSRKSLYNHLLRMSEREWDPRGRPG